MTVLLLTPAVLSALLLGAHFLRSGHVLIVLLVLSAVPLLLLRRRGAVRLVQAMLLLGALEWLRTLWQLAQFRVMVGAPYLRMALILGAVALFTALSAALLSARARPVRSSGTCPTP